MYTLSPLHFISQQTTRTFKIFPTSTPSSRATTTMGLKEVVYSERAVRKNAAIIDYCRTSGAAIAGATAGILGLTGLYGFVFFIVYSVLLSFMLATKAGTHWKKYFTTRRQIWFDGVIGGLFTYVLLWTFLYGMVHVY